MIYNRNTYTTPKYSEVDITGDTFNALELLGPIITLGSTGITGQILTSQGGNPPKWITSSSGLPILGTALQQLRVNAGGTALEYFTASSSTPTLLNISANSTTTPNSIYNLSAGIPVNFKSSDSNTILYLDETNERVGIGITSPTSKLHNAGSTGLGTIVSSAATLTLDNTKTIYVFSGTTTTWTLPAVTGSTDRVYFIKNRGSGAITLNAAAAANEIYTTSAVNTLNINAGEAYTLISDGIYFNIL